MPVRSAVRIRPPPLNKVTKELEDCDESDSIIANNLITLWLFYCR